jgi:hypothetical protein
MTRMWLAGLLENSGEGFQKLKTPSEVCLDWASAKQHEGVRVSRIGFKKLLTEALNPVELMAPRFWSPRLLIYSQPQAPESSRPLWGEGEAGFVMEPAVRLWHRRPRSTSNQTRHPLKGWRSAYRLTELRFNLPWLFNTRLVTALIFTCFVAFSCSWFFARRSTVARCFSLDHFNS